MLSRIKLFIKYYLFWTLFFVVARLFFIVYNFHFTYKLPITDIFLCFFYGLRMDLAFGAYIMLIALLAFILLSFSPARWIYRILDPIMLTFLFLATCIIFADSELYRNWGFRMDATPLLYLKTPKEALASIPIWMLFLFFTGIVLYFLAWVYLFRKLFKPKHQEEITGWKSIPVFAFIAILCIIPMRGGIGIAPMHTGSVYFSRNHFSNHAAVNVLWHVGYSLSKINKQDHYTGFMQTGEASEILRSKLKWDQLAPNILNQSRPNVVIIVLESFTRQIINKKYQDKEITPGFNQLIKEGIYFDNCYASGDRSDKGLVAIISGFPAQPQTSIIRFPEKTQKLPYLSHILKELQYHTSFYYGGDIEFANMKSYFINGGFDLLVTKTDFRSKQFKNKWGAHDHVVFNRLFEDIKNNNSKFLKIIFTLSSHEPYDVPMPSKFIGNSEECSFINSACYTDSCLFDFINRCKTTPSWKNTLFVLVADHGNRHPGNLAYNIPEKFEIPLLFIGGAISRTDTIIHTIASQTDITASILYQMHLTTDDYIFSQNLFGAPEKAFAFYVFNNGFGCISGNSTQIFDITSEKIIVKQGPCADSAGITGKAFYQLMTDQFRKL